MRNKDDLFECPVAITVSLVCRKWKLLIIRNLMCNIVFPKRYFKEL